MLLTAIPAAWFFSAVSGENFGIAHGENTAAADGAAAMMLAVTFFVIGMVAAFALAIFWKSRKTDPSLEELARRLRPASPAPGSREASPAKDQAAEWERPADWWKNPAE